MPITRNPIYRPPQSRGFALIEVLVTVLVLAIGLLGLAGLQTRSLRFAQTSVQHTQAILLANEMADRIRSNPAGSALTTSAQNAVSSAYTTGATKDDCLSGTCTPAQLAGYDLAQWSSALADSKRLTNGTGVVCIDSTPDDGTASTSEGGGTTNTPACDGTGGVYAIKIWWNESDRTRSGSNFQRFSTSIAP